MTAAECALDLVKDGYVVGLGSGAAAMAFLHALAAKVAKGLRVRVVATSRDMEAAAARLGVALARPDEVTGIDVAVDGADEVAPDLSLIKGRGGALVREKIVIAAASRVIILVGPEKVVDKLGSRGVLPVEVVPFALAWCQKWIAELGLPCQPRTQNGSLLVSDNGNHILDCKTTAIDDPSRLERSLRALPGVVATGLFLDVTDTVLVQDGKSVRVMMKR
jgi:ribose 5-phosphate isomerase A